VSDHSETDVRRVGLAAGLVDYKICAIHPDWSGLLFTRRRGSITPAPAASSEEPDPVLANVRGNQLSREPMSPRVPVTGSGPLETMKMNLMFFCIRLKCGTERHHGDVVFAPKPGRFGGPRRVDR
jgi:hypothetical protein